MNVCLWGGILPKSILPRLFNKSAGSWLASTLNGKPLAILAIPVMFVVFGIFCAKPKIIII